ncbi:RICIN domain-containing protein [Actinopolyspora saharensis]|uniref:RICIN domain-containing protein n=1 Tax=Actinopolyspora saharensis TaxID=995062 RepID=UPI003F675CA7
MKLNKRIALVLAAAFSMVGVMGAGAGAAEQHGQQEQVRPQARDAQTSINAGEPYHLYNRSIHQFLFPRHWSTSEGHRLGMWNKHKTGSQRFQEQWKFLRTGYRDVFRIKNVGSGLCMAPKEDDSRRRVVQKECDRGDRAQWWSVRKDEGLRISPFNDSNMVLSPYRNLHRGGSIVLYEDVDSLSQRWNAVSVD